jgi:hypothetical protein
MNHGMVKLSDILGGFKFTPKRPPVEPIKAPIPKPPRVVGDPTRTPVNRQAALMLSKPSWLNDPLPPELPKQPELPKLREENARLRQVNETLVGQNSALRRRVEMLTKLVNQKPTAKMEKIPEPAPQPDSEREKLLERLTQ